MNSKSPLFVPSETYKPFRYPWAIQVWTEHERMHWTKEEVEMTDDVNDWKMGKLSPAEKNLITQILRMFTQADVNVGTFYTDILIPAIKNNEVRKMLRGFVNREDTHQEAYALLNDTLGLPDSDYTAFLEYAEMAEKHEFMLDASAITPRDLGLAMAKGVFNEGVSLFASFVILLSFQRRGLMKAMGKVVEWSIKDESKHVDGVARLFRVFCAEHPEIVTDDFKRAIYEMARECVALEDKFVDLVFAMGPVEGQTPDEVKQYIRFIADRRLTQLGLKENWGIEKNPLDWVDWVLNGADHTNFFENKVAEYEVGGIEGEWTYDEPRFFILYTRDGCGYCEKAKHLITERGDYYAEIDVTDDERRQAFYDQHGWEGKDRTVPKIWDATPSLDEDVFIGGFMELEASYNKE